MGIPLTPEGGGRILPQGEPLTLRAQYTRAVRQPDGTLLLEARGAVELLYGTRRLRTEALQLDTATALVQGEAPFELITPEGWLRGQSLTYFYEQQRDASARLRRFSILRAHAAQRTCSPP
jgi:hypothetical protein